MKRFKLVFSQTTSIFVLPPNSLMLLPEFGLGDNFVEIDGAGLVSQHVITWFGKPTTKMFPSRAGTLGFKEGLEASKEFG
jgi:hypothetical protein